MTRTIILLIAISLVNISYAQKKAQCDSVIYISLKKNLMIKDSVDLWILSLDTLEKNISKLRFKSKKKLQSLRQLIRSLELVRDSAGFSVKEYEPVALNLLPESPNTKWDDTNLDSMDDLENVIKSRSKSAKILKELQRRNESFQKNQINILKEISKINLKTKNDIELLSLHLLLNQKLLFDMERLKEYEQMVNSYEQAMYSAQSAVKQSIDNVKLTYAKAYRRFVKNKSNIKI